MPYLENERVLISFSGGRTSAYMTHLLLKDGLRDRANVEVVFANTGHENEATLEFVRDCDSFMDFRTTWIEAEVRHGNRQSNGHRVVDFFSACRNAEPFAEDISKYGIPNAQSPHCTRNLKLNPLTSYIKSLGWENFSYVTAIGIRTDEQRRVKTYPNRRVCYPLVDKWPSDKEDVLLFWEDQKFDLRLEEHQGNCKTCWKKSFKKLVRLYKEDASQFSFFEKMEKTMGRVGPEFLKYSDAPNRVFFRGRNSVLDIRRMAENDSPSREQHKFFDSENSGCSESCEIYETE